MRPGFPRRPPARARGPRAVLAGLALVASLWAAAPGLAAAQEAEPPGDDRPAATDTVPREPGFPHRDHAGLFPVCTGCHAGAAGGPPAEMYPDPELCTGCHDGEERERVTWRGPDGRATLLRFDHLEHARGGEARDESAATLRCADCHAPEGAPGMTVDRGVAGRCLDCHAHRADDHYVDAACSTCHRPLAESRLPPDRIAALPVPSPHERPEFLARIHGDRAPEGVARCSVCHTRERCTSCHVDAGTVGAIADLAPAPAEMELPAFGARYPIPRSHRADDFLATHGREVAAAECSTCHTRESCTTCHVESPPPAVGRLPGGRQVEAPGARVERRPPDSHASPYFVEDHEVAAATAGISCSSCHAESTCTECHRDDREPVYHPPDFALQHSSRAYGAEMECGNCHDTSVFCRDCHTRLGMGTRGRLQSGFHDRPQLWLFRHGQAARQGLESCTTCHRQTDCLQCHSELGAFQVSPHGPGFDARRLFDRNPQICFACHIDDPLDRSRP